MWMYEDDMPITSALIANASVHFTPAQRCLAAMEWFLIECEGLPEDADAGQVEHIRRKIRRIQDTFEETPDGFIKPLYVLTNDPIWAEIKGFKKSLSWSSEKIRAAETILMALLCRVFRPADEAELKLFTHLMII